MDIRVTINGEPVLWQVKPGERVLDILRREGFASVKHGCGEGDCGSCTILVDGETMRACLLLAGQMEGREITTVDALGTPDKPHPIQKAFVECGAVQCGFCTPGMILSAYALIKRIPDPTEEEVREALDGNLCRCTGYVKIVEAVLVAAKRMQA
ncbi:MAG: (2Fe-2S)-binding protein [Deltaproteobacteria bacterium]|nr:(2Fe-2S)-binding protein [Deltaproteobacteria bacterium]